MGITGVGAAEGGINIAGSQIKASSTFQINTIMYDMKLLIHLLDIPLIIIIITKLVFYIYSTMETYNTYPSITQLIE